MRSEIVVKTLLHPRVVLSVRRRSVQYVHKVSCDDPIRLFTAEELVLVYFDGVSLLPWMQLIVPHETV